MRTECTSNLRSISWCSYFRQALGHRGLCPTKEKPSLCCSPSRAQSNYHQRTPFSACFPRLKTSSLVTCGQRQCGWVIQVPQSWRGGKEKQGIIFATLALKGLFTLSSPKSPEEDTRCSAKCKADDKLQF